MNTPFFISWRYQRGRQKKRLVSLIATFSNIGIALGVAVLILGLSAMNGFERELNNRVLAVVPHIEIGAYSENAETGIDNYQDLIVLLADNPLVKAISPFVTFTALVENGNKMKVVQIKGVNKTEFDKVSALGNFVLNDNWVHFGAQGGLVLGYGIAKELGLKVGDWVTLLISNANGTVQQIQFEKQRIQVTGILRLDGQLDHNYALVPLNIAQKWLGYNKERVTGIELAVKDPFNVHHFSYANLMDYPQRLYAQNWTVKYGYMYRDINLIRMVMYIAMVLVVGVACFNIVSTLVMAVKDKQGDIAIMRTLGANDQFIKRIFIWYGLQSGMKGCFIGILFGVILSLNLTSLIQGLEHFIGRKLLSDGIYFVDFLPSELHWQDVILVLLSVLILSLIASVYPAQRAAKLQPAQVLSSH